MSPSVINIHISSKWVRVKEDLYLCKRCCDPFYGRAWQLQIQTHGLHNATTTVADVVLCNDCYKTIKDDNVQ